MRNIYIFILSFILAFGAGFTVGVAILHDNDNAEPPAEIRTVFVKVETETETEAEAPTAAEAEAAGIGGGVGRNTKIMEVTATAYCPCTYCTDGDGITATGTKATAGRTVAVDPDVIPYGSEITINGHTYIAEDCGGAINGNDIDIFFDTHEEANLFGRQILTAYINE